MAPIATPASVAATTAADQIRADDDVPRAAAGANSACSSGDTVDRSAPHRHATTEAGTRRPHDAQVRL
jgi:hypothetical protein